MIYRFKFICTKYHRGRVRINWDPHGEIGSTGNYTTETYTKIVDISEETDVEFRVPYTQPTAYLKCLDANIFSVAQASTNNSSMGLFFNGILTMRVLNEQTSPVTSADITVLTFARAADNIEFAGPRQISSLISPYAVQSGLDMSSTTCELGVKPSSADPNINLVYMGEHCVSLRSLMRRSSQYMRTITPATGGLDNLYVTNAYLNRSPIYPGFDSSGLMGATGLTSAVAEPYNWVNWNAVTWFSMCFVGSRGSYIYSVNRGGRDPSSSVRMIRSDRTHTNSDWLLTTAFTSGADYVFQSSMCYTDTKDNGVAGQAVTNQLTQSGVTALAPMYSRYKFLSNNVSTRTEGTSADESDTDSLTVETIVTTELAPDLDVEYTDIYCAAGTDFNLIFFLNVPSYVTYTSFPGAVAHP